MRYIIVDDTHERFDQAGELVLTEDLGNNLGMYSIKFNDGETERFLAYQIDGVTDE